MSLQKQNQDQRLLAKQESLASVYSLAFHSSFLTANLYTFTGICTIESEQVNTFKFSVI